MKPHPEGACAGARARAAAWVLAGLQAAGLGAPHADAAPARAPADAALGTRAVCAAYTGVPAGFGASPHAGMVRLPGGRFDPGSHRGYADERPAGAVSLRPFWIDRTEVTNAQFERFVLATGYRTQAEREGGSVVFRAPAPGRMTPDNSWWVHQAGAQWRRPEGRTVPPLEHAGHPVVQVTRADAEAYARWLGHELPSEAQWEWAARAGALDEGPDGEPRDHTGAPAANYWQGIFPDTNTAEDGHTGRAPVGCYAANAWGLHDMIGNVWEWTRDAYHGPRQPHRNGDPSAVARRTSTTVWRDSAAVIKGGSYLCAANYCVRYRAAARHPQEAGLGTSHVGFRTVRAAD
jgi:sulfatase modifying factor 1